MQPKISAVDLGEFIATGARAGANGKMLIALNLSEVPQRIKANLQAYSTTSEIIRYRLTLDGWSRESLTTRASDDLVIESGETVVWIFNRPIVTWQPADLIAATPLGAAQLNATANIPGTFTYSPPAGTILSAGTQTLSATFTPSDTNSYLPVTASATIHVLKLGQTLDLPALTNRTTADSPFDLAATASSGLPVRFQVLAGPASVAGNTVTLTAPGIVTLRAVQDGNATYDAAFVGHSFNVTKRNTRPTIASPTEVTVTEGDQLQVQISATDSDTVLQIVPGLLMREVWTNLSNGGTLADLRDPTANPRWPDQPDLIGAVPTFETPADSMERYGVRLSGLLSPPETGDYTFYLSSDDEGVLYLSTDEQPANKAVTDDGTPPLSAEQTFTLTVSVQPEIRLGDISRPSEGTFYFTWSSQPGVTYHVQFKNNLGEGPWTQLEPAITAIDVTASFSTPVSPDSARFYRVVRN